MDSGGQGEVSDGPAIDDQYDPAANSARGYELAIRAMREMRIRSGEIEPSTAREREWQREGMVPVNMLDAVKVK